VSAQTQSEPRFCSACGKEPTVRPLNPNQWGGHHALCPRYGKAPDVERKP
jgi:hypothetical protein